jgi:hypothetical protein
VFRINRLEASCSICTSVFELSRLYPNLSLVTPGPVPSLSAQTSLPRSYFTSRFLNAVLDALLATPSLIDENSMLDEQATKLGSKNDSEGRTVEADVETSDGVESRITLVPCRSQ